MRRVKTEQNTLIELIKKREPIQPIQHLQPIKAKTRKISQLVYFNQQHFSNAKIKLSNLMTEILTPSPTNFIPLKIQTKNRSIINSKIPRQNINNNKPSRYIEIQDNQIFKKHNYMKQKQVNSSQNDTIRIDNSNLKINIFKKQKQITYSNEQQEIISSIISWPTKISKEKSHNTQLTNRTIKEEQNLKPLYHVEGSVEKIIEDFNNRMFGSRTVKKLINSVKPWVNQLQEKKMTKYKRIRIGLVQLLTHIHKLKLTLEEFGQGNVFPKIPYQSIRSEKFFCLCKMNKVNEVQQLLEIEKYLVYEYDPSFMTALHWCCVRNCRNIALLLLKGGADPDAQDMIGRTPLFLALLHNNNDIAQLLLYHKADPWNKGNLDYEESVQINLDGRTLLQQARRTHILLRMTPPSQRQYIWQQKQLQMLCD